MLKLSHFVVSHRWWVVAAWLLLAAVGAATAQRATSALSYNFSLPGQAGYEANQQIATRFGTGGENTPVLLIVTDDAERLPPLSAPPITAALTAAVPGMRIASYGVQPALLSRDGHTGVIAIYPHAVPGPDPYAAALPAIEGVSPGQLRSLDSIEQWQATVSQHLPR